MQGHGPVRLYLQAAAAERTWLADNEAAYRNKQLNAEDIVEYERWQTVHAGQEPYLASAELAEWRQLANRQGVDGVSIRTPVKGVILYHKMLLSAFRFQSAPP